MMNPAFYKSIHKEAAVPEGNRLHTKCFNLQQHLAKLLVCGMVFILLFTSFLIMRGVASVHSMNPEAGEEVVIVLSGDTLWDIAGRYTDNTKDIRKTVFEIKERNQLTTVNLMPGQELIIP